MYNIHESYSATQNPPATKDGLKKISASFLKKIPPLKLKKSEKAWMEAAYLLIKQNKKPDFRQLRMQLDNILPITFVPNSIPHHLMYGNGEYITILGVLALEKTNRILEECNQVMQAIRQILRDEPTIQKIEASKISGITGLDQDAIEIICYLIIPYSHFATSWGTNKQNAFGFSNFSIDPAGFINITTWTTIEELIIEYFKSNKESPKNDQLLPNTLLTVEEYQILISLGESNTLEFKRCLRAKVNNTLNQYSEHNVMKTIAAFLNSEGGRLFIGIDDDKSVAGLDTDFATFVSKDKKDAFLKHFDNITHRSFGSRYSRYFKLSFPEIEGKVICEVLVKQRSVDPVVITDEKNEEQFYIRRSASTIALKIGESIRYIKEHWASSNIKYPYMQ